MQGGKAELLRVPFGDYNCLKLPPDAGPVGLMAAYSATLRGASKVTVVDRHPDRLVLAEKIGAIPIDDSKAAPVDRVLALTGGEGADRGCECVGYQPHDPEGHERRSPRRP